MGRQDDWSDESGHPSRRRVLVAVGTGAIVLGVLAAGVVVLLSGDKDPPRKVQDLTVVTILPPPPPPPPPPEKEPPPEKMVEQTPVKQEIIEEKPIDIPKDAPPDLPKTDAPPDGPLGLDDAGRGPGDLPGRPGGRGLIGGGGGGGGGSKWGWYASIVQSQIEVALRSNERTRHAVMQIQVRLWSDGTGRVSRVQLVSSTGNPELDTVIRDDVLGRLTLREPPPKDMPMPIITRVIARKPS